MLLESALVSKACQATSRTSPLLPVGSFAGVCFSTIGGRSGTPLAGVRQRNLRTWSKAPSTEGFLRSLEGGSRGISNVGLIKAFQGQILQRHEKSSGVGLYSRDGLINPPPGKIRFGVAKVLLVMGGGMMLGAYLATHLSIMLENFEHFSQEVEDEDY